MAGIKAVVAVLPLAWLLFGMGKLKMPAWRAGLIALLITLAAAFFGYGMAPYYMGQAILDGAMLALFPIMWVIISALFIYNLSVETGGMDTIRQMLAGISPDRRVQALIIAFSFGGFLEAAAGFGTAVAIPAGILSAMGFSPLLAATLCMVANTVPVAFGVLGIPVITLAQVTSLPLDRLAIYTCIQLFPFVILLPFVIVFITTGSIKAVRGAAGVSLASGLAFASGQTAAAWHIGPELAAVTGSLASLAATIAWVKLRPVKNPWMFESDADNGIMANRKVKASRALVAWSPYIAILLIIIATRLLPFLGFLEQYPFVIKKQFYFGEGGKPLTFQLVTGAGTVLLMAGIIGALIQGSHARRLLRVFLHTAGQLGPTAAAVLSIVVLSRVMGYSGMAGSIASVMASCAGRFYAFLSPIVGGLGTFLTGSDTSSNVLFGDLQKQAALQLGMDAGWIAAANASGATAGKMVSPQSISVATAATGLSGKEGEILAGTMKYCMAYLVAMGIIVYAFSNMI